MPVAEPPSLNALSLPVPPVKQVVEGALMAAGGPLTIDRILGLYPDPQRPSPDEVRSAVAALAADYRDRGIELAEVAGGWRIQVRRDVAPWVGRLWEEKPPRYSRALLETLALIAYRQPITRGEIEEIRGVSVSTQIVKTLTERDWIRVVGHRDVPGRPALYATTRRFLDYFGLRSLNDLPPLAEIRDPAFFADALGLADGESGEPGGARRMVSVDADLPPQDDPAAAATGDPPARPVPVPAGRTRQDPGPSMATTPDRRGDDDVPGPDDDGRSA